MWALYIIGYLFLGVVFTTTFLAVDDGDWDESDSDHIGNVFTLIVLWPAVFLLLAPFTLFLDALMPAYIRWAKGLRNGGWRNFLTKNKGD